MFIKNLEIFQGILIGLSIFICSIILIIPIYFLYRYQKKIPINLNEEEIIKSSRITEELMRKSLQFAKTAEQVADHNQKRFSIK